MENSPVFVEDLILQKNALMSGNNYFYSEKITVLVTVSLNLNIGAAKDGDVKLFRRFLKKCLKFKMLVWENFV